MSTAGDHQGRRFSLRVLVPIEEAADALRSAITTGLSAPQAALPLADLADERTAEFRRHLEDGSAYYLGRGYRDLTTQNAAAIMQAGAPETLLVCGASPADRIEPLVAAGLAHGLTRVVVVGPRAPAVTGLANMLTSSAATPPLTAIVADPLQHLDQISADGRCLCVVDADTLASLDRRSQAGFLRDLARHLEPGDAVLLAIDLLKERSRLTEAFDDPEGMQANISRNGLMVLSRILEARLDPYGWRHHARWNEETHRVDLRLVAHGEQRIVIDQLGIDRTFADGETIQVGQHAVYLRNGLDAELAFAGLSVSQWLTDEDGNTALCLATP